MNYCALTLAFLKQFSLIQCLSPLVNGSSASTNERHIHNKSILLQQNSYGTVHSNT